MWKAVKIPRLIVLPPCGHRSLKISPTTTIRQTGLISILSLGTEHVPPLLLYSKEKMVWQAYKADIAYHTKAQARTIIQAFLVTEETEHILSLSLNFVLEIYSK